jgi:hypothetical protein
MPPEDPERHKTGPQAGFASNIEFSADRELASSITRLTSRESDSRHLVVQGSVLSLETLARCAALFGFVHRWPWHRTAAFR